MEENLKERKSKKEFWKGAFAGAVAAIIMTAIVVGVFGIGQSGVDIDNSKMRAIKSIVDEYYLYGDNVNEDDLKEWIYKGYMAGLGDEYSAYYTKEEFEALNQSTILGEFYGIGIKMMQEPETGTITVVGTYEGYPADKAGIKSGDILTAVDGQETAGLDLTEVTDKIKGEKGTKVDLTLIRGETGEKYKVTVERTEVTVKTVEGKMLDGDIGYIQISEFTMETDTQFEEVFDKLNADGMKSMIIDLRNNTGGTVEDTCNILDMLLPEGKIVYTKDKAGNIKEETSDAENHYDKPIAVLVNGYTASASEIFTAALQDYDMATVIGTKTFGKGIVQQLFPLSDGSGVKLTISEYFSPKDRQIHGKGIEPDITLEDSRKSATDANDAQLQKAIEVVKNKM